MNPRIPVVKIPGDTESPGIGSPHGEVYAFNAVYIADLSAQAGITVQVLTFTQEMDVKFCEKRGKSVRVIKCKFTVVIIGFRKLICQFVELLTGQPGFKETKFVDALHLD